MKHYLAPIFAIFLSISVCAQEYNYTPEELAFLEEIQADSIYGQTGSISLSSAHCTLNVPEGFVFLNPTQSEHLLVDYWDNPQERVDGILGTLVKEDAGIYDNVETAYVVYYENAGYVSDKDASSCLLYTSDAADE